MDRARLPSERVKARGEPTEDPLLLFSVLMVYGSRTWSSQWRRDARACHSIFGAGGKTKRAFSRSVIRASTDGFVAAPYRRDHRRTSPSRPRNCALRSRRTSPFCDTVLWPRRGRGNPLLEVVILLLLWPSGSALNGHQGDALKIGRDSAHSAMLTYVLNFSVFQHSPLWRFRSRKTRHRGISINLLKDRSGPGSGADGDWRWSGCVSTLTGRAAGVLQNITSGLVAMRSTGYTHGGRCS